MRVLDSFQKQITYASTTSTFIGMLPAGAYIQDVVVNVGTIFNASGADTIDIGTSTNQIFVASGVAGTAKGFPTVTKLATCAGVLSTTDQTAIYAIYLPGSTDATAGSANICISYAYNE